MSVEINVTEQIVEVTPTDSQVNVNITETPVAVNVTDQIIQVTETGLQGPQGPSGPGVPTGGSPNQVLAKLSGTNYDTYWRTDGAEWGYVSGNISAQVDLQNALNLKVPYTGATGNINLGEYGIKSGYYQVDTTPTNTPADQGTMYWDDQAETVALIMNGTIQKIGEDLFFHVKNSTGSTIAKGTCVRFAGTDGNSGKILIAPFTANGTYPSQYFMGVTAEDIDNGENGKVYQFGKIRGVNTSAFQDGDILYASTSVAGGFQTAVPTAPNNIIIVAAVINAANNGTLMIRSTLGSNINNDEGVKITNPTNGQVLKYNSTTQLWENGTDAGNNIYNSDGTLTSNRTVNNGGYSLTFNGGFSVKHNTQSALFSTYYPTGTDGLNLYAGGGGVNAVTTGDFYDASRNTSFGIEALYNNTTGNHNSAFGLWALLNNTTGRYNTAIGLAALNNNTSGNSNVAIGLDALNGITTSNNNVAVGFNAGFRAVVGGINYASENSIFIGYDTYANNSNQSNQIVIGHESQGLGSNTIVLGNPSTSFGRWYGNLLLGSNTNNGVDRLQVTGSALFSSSITANSFIKSGGTSSQYLMADGSTSTLTNPVTGTGVSGQVSYWNGTNTQTGSNNLFWNASNNRLGVGTNTPSSPFHVRLNTNSTTKSTIITQEVFSSSSGYTDYFKFDLGANNSRGGKIVFGELGGPFPESSIEFALNAINISQGGEYPIYMTTNGIARMVLFGSSGNMLLQNGGIFSDSGDRLQVTGTGKFTSSITANSFVKSGGISSQYLMADGSVSTLPNIANWDAAYNDKINSAAVTGTTTKTLTLTQQDGGTITASWTDINTDAVTSVFGRTGAVVATSGDYNTSQVTESGNLYYTDARARLSLSAGTGISYNNTTGVITNSSPDQVVSLTGAGTTSITGTYPSFTITSNDQYVGTVTSVGLSSSTSGVTIGSTPVTTNGTITINISTASGSQNGLLSSTDWTTFNNKQNALTNPVTGTGTTNYLPKFTGTSTIGNSIVYDNGTNVGIGTSSPSSKLTVVGGAGDGIVYSDGTVTNYFGTAGGGLSEIGTLTNTAISILTNGTGKVRITSGGNVLIGTTTDAGYKLDVNGVTRFQDIVRFKTGAWNLSDEGRSRFFFGNAGRTFFGSADGYEYRSSIDTTLMILNDSGNLGLGVTPSAWLGGFKAIDINTGGTIASSGTTNIRLFQNAYYDGTNYIYKNSVAASRYDMSTSGHQWFIAPSGTAGNTITFTQAMTLNASGDLLLKGTYNPYTAANRGNITLNGTSSNIIVFANNTSSNGYILHQSNQLIIFNERNDAMTFGTNNTERMRVSAGGNLLLGTITDNGTDRLQVSGSANITGNLTVDTNTLFVDATNNRVGIGTTSPARKLDVLGDIRVQSGTIDFSNDFNNQIWVSSSAMNFKLNGSERMHITSGGNVGIGTTSPTAFLHIAAGTTAKAQIRLASSTAPTTPNDGDIWFDGTDLKMRIGGVTKTFTLT